MYIREMRPDDVSEILAIHAKSPMKYDIPMLNSPNILTSLVMVDDNDSPHVMLAAERVAEIFLVIDRDWQSPAFRAVAVADLHGQIVPKLEGMGIKSAYAFLGPDVPRGYDKRLYRLGARQMVWRCVKWISEVQENQ